MKGKRLRSLSGTVLIMVLTVMLVLIIMLMATLTVVTTASQRIYTKYEENQAYYTARSALDVFTSSMLSDADYYAYKADGTTVRDYLYTDVSVSPSVDKTLSNAMKQGTALQFDLYKIRSQNDDGIDLKYAENPIDTDKVFVLDIGKENNNNNYSLNSSDNYTKDGITYTGLEYIEYDVMLPMVDDGSNKYGKMVDTDFDDEDGDDATDDQIARIRVEVLDRKLATEPSYTTQQIKEYIGGDTSLIADDTAFKAAIAKGSRNRDYMKIKITSTVKMMDVEGVAVVIFETTEKDPPAGDNAITTTGGFAGGSGAQFGAAGGAATMDSGVSKIADGNTVSGKLFSVGSFEWVSASKTDFGKGDKVVAMKDIKFKNDPQTYSKEPGMFFYAGGTFDARKNICTDDSADVSVICNNFISSGGQYKIKGNVFCDTYEVARNGEVTGTLYANNIASESVTKVLDDDGNVVALKVRAWNSDVSLWENGKIQEVSITSTWVPKPGGESWETEEVRTVTVLNEYNYADYAGKIQFVDDGGNLSTGSITPISSKVDILSYTTVEKDGKVYRKIDLPDNLASDCSDKFIEIPTAQAMFKDYCMDDAFDMSTGDLKLKPGETDPYSADNKSAHIITGTKMLAKFIDNPNINAGTATMNDIISVVNAETLEGSPGPGRGASYEITLDGTKYYKIDPSMTYEDVTWTVKGNNGRLILIIPDNAKVEWKKCKLVTESIDPINGGTTSVKNGTTEAPKVDIYGGDQSELIISQKGYISGYIIMPTGKITADGGLGGSINYDDLPDPMGDTAIIGSVLCGEFNQSNKTGVLYLDKNSGGSTPGEPALSIQASHYSRN